MAEAQIQATAACVPGGAARCCCSCCCWRRRCWCRATRAAHASCEAIAAATGAEVELGEAGLRLLPRLAREPGAWAHRRHRRRPCATADGDDYGIVSYRADLERVEVRVGAAAAAAAQAGGARGAGLAGRCWRWSPARARTESPWTSRAWSSATCPGPGGAGRRARRPTAAGRPDPRGPGLPGRACGSGRAEPAGGRAYATLEADGELAAPRHRGAQAGGGPAGGRLSGGPRWTTPLIPGAGWTSPARWPMPARATCWSPGCRTWRRAWTARLDGSRQRAPAA